MMKNNFFLCQYYHSAYPLFKRHDEYYIIYQQVS